MKNKKSIVFIGSSCIDEYYEMDHMPDLGDKVILKPLESKVGGMIANAAAVASSYGMETYLMDVISKSDYNQMLEDDLKEYNIKLDMIRYDATLPDAKCLIFLKDGERIVWVIPTQKKDVEVDDEQKRILEKAEYVYTSLEELRRFKDRKGFMSWLHQINTKIVVDVEWINEENMEEAWDSISHSDIIFVNSEGDEQLSKCIADDYTKQLTDRGCLVIKTKGAEGCEVYTTDGENWSCPAYKVIPVDTTGAGDTFNSSFVYGLSCGWGLQEAGTFANAAAGRAILNMGARSGAVGEAAVKDFMNREGTK